MSLTITLPDDLEHMLRQAAVTLALPVEELAIDLLREAFIDHDAPTIEEIVARIRATPPNPANFRPASGSLAEDLEDRTDAEFDLASWEAEWAQVEAEMKAMDEADELADWQFPASTLATNTPTPRERSQ